MHKGWAYTKCVLTGSLSLSRPSGVRMSLQSYLHPHWDSTRASGLLYSWRGVSKQVPRDPFARPWLILPLLHHAATLIHSKMFSSCVRSRPKRFLLFSTAPVSKLSNQPQIQGRTCGIFSSCYIKAALIYYMLKETNVLSVPTLMFTSL